MNIDFHFKPLFPLLRNFIQIFMVTEFRTLLFVMKRRLLEAKLPHFYSTLKFDGLKNKLIKLAKLTNIYEIKYMYKIHKNALLVHKLHSGVLFAKYPSIYCNVGYIYKLKFYIFVPSASTSLIISVSSASDGFCPSERITVPNSLFDIVPSPSLSNNVNASLNSIKH